MVKFIATTVLAAVANALTEVSNLAVTCSGGNSMTVNFDTNRDISLAKLSAGDCDDSAITHTDDTASSHSITFDPYACNNQVVDPADPSSYSVDIEVGFSASLSSSMDLLVKEHHFNARCGFQSTYEATYTFGDIDMSEHDEGQHDGEGLSFSIKAYTDDTYTTEVDGSAVMSAGSNVFLQITPSDEFDAATFTFTPVTCTIKDADATNSYPLVDYTGSQQCKNDDVDLSMAKSGNAWNMSYVLFLFNNEQTSNYVLTCTIDLCLNSDGSSSCANFDTCLA